MPDTIYTIEEWNARLSPPVADDSDAEPGNCGCCAMPRCCAPQLQCQSMDFTFGRQGFVKPDSGSDSDQETTSYLKQVARETRNWTVTSDNAPLTSADCGYFTSTFTINATHDDGFEFLRSYHGMVSGGGSESGSGCPMWPYDIRRVCVASGYSEYSDYDTKCWGDPPYTRPFARNRYFRHELSDAEGDTTPAFAAWRDEFPTDEDYDAAVAAYETALEAWNECELETPGECGPEPTEPNSRPEMETFPACWWKITTTITYDPHYFGYNSDGSLVDDPDAGAFAEWIAEGAIGSPPCSGTGTIEEYTNTPLSSLPVYEPGTPTTEDIYETPITAAQWKSDVAAVITAAAFPDEGCMGDTCGASRDIYPVLNGSSSAHYNETIFRYRWKINKCCGLYAGLTWLEVFYQKEFLEWLDTLTGSESVDFPAPTSPVVTTKAWEWEGSTRPTECDNSDSADSVIGPNDPGFNPFDDETRWSDWSLKVAVPDGEEGQVLLRSLYVTCYRSIYGTKPDHITLYADFNQSDLNEDGQPDPA